jgi:flagellar hook-associated protein 2
MSDIYIPGVKSRFDTDKLVDDLMKIERLPKERSEKNTEALRDQKTYWQDTGRRLSSLRESARFLYSFQNPFSDRRVTSSDESVLSGTATRGAIEQERSFFIKQIAQSDRFLSSPGDSAFKVEAGTYTFLVGKGELSFDFRGGSVQDWIDVVNRRGQNKIRASLVTVQPGTKSILIESLMTGIENRLGFLDRAVDLAIQIGIIEQDQSLREINLALASAGNSERTFFDGEVLTVEPGGTGYLAFDPALPPSNKVLRFEAATTEQMVPEESPASSRLVIPSTGSASYRNIIIDNDLSSMPWWAPPERIKRLDTMQVLSLIFSDGSSVDLPPVAPLYEFTSYEYRLADFAKDKTIVSMEIVNGNTNTAMQIRNMQVAYPESSGGLKPKTPVSVARDAVFTMEGIEVTRPSNTVNDLVPSVNITIKSTSSTPVWLGVEPDREQVKDAIISVVGNYNRLMAELNVLTRTDNRIITELSYLTAEEQTDMQKRIGVFSGDSTLNQLKNNLQRAASAPYPTSVGRDLTLLSQIGIAVDVRGAGGAGYDPSRLRGYLEIDEKKLDAALQSQLTAIAQLFGYDTDGDLIIDSGIAYSMEMLARPFVETGGIISLKTSTIDSKISQDERRIQSLDRQLAAKEASLKSQYGQMESAYARMERLGTSLDQFSQQNNNNNGR